MFDQTFVAVKRAVTVKYMNGSYSFRDFCLKTQLKIFFGLFEDLENVETSLSLCQPKVSSPCVVKVPVFYEPTDGRLDNRCRVHIAVFQIIGTFDHYFPNVK